ncbi:MAG: hypothetical protein V1792_12615 [Pseudomonadota bacterium]
MRISNTGYKPRKADLDRFSVNRALSSGFFQLYYEDGRPGIVMRATLSKPLSGLDNER